MSQYDGPPDADPVRLVVAYCAPGLKDYVSRLLEADNEQVSEIIEDPDMKGRTDFMISTRRKETMP